VSFLDCPEPWRMLTALGALFFLAGARFMALRWRELDIAQHRVRAAVREIDAETAAIRALVRRSEPFSHRSTDDSAGVSARQEPSMPDLDERVVRAESSRPPAPPAL
jgi:hypothetical protein